MTTRTSPRSTACSAVPLAAGRTVAPPLRLRRPQHRRIIPFLAGPIATSPRQVRPQRPQPQQDHNGQRHTRHDEHNLQRRHELTVANLPRPSPQLGGPRCATTTHTLPKIWPWPAAADAHRLVHCHRSPRRKPGTPRTPLAGRHPTIRTQLPHHRRARQKAGAVVEDIPGFGASDSQRMLTAGTQQPAVLVGCGLLAGCSVYAVHRLRRTAGSWPRCDTS